MALLWIDPINALLHRLNQLALKKDSEAFQFDDEYIYREELIGFSDEGDSTAAGGPHCGQQWGLLHFDKPLIAPKVGCQNWVLGFCVLLFVLPLY